MSIVTVSTDIEINDVCHPAKIEAEVEGQYKPSTWGCHGGEEPELPEIIQVCITAETEDGHEFVVDWDDLSASEQNRIETIILSKGD